MCLLHELGLLYDMCLLDELDLLYDMCVLHELGLLYDMGFDTQSAAAAGPPEPPSDFSALPNQADAGIPANSPPLDDAGPLLTFGSPPRHLDDPGVAYQWCRSSCRAPASGR